VEVVRKAGSWYKDFVPIVDLPDAASTDVVAQPLELFDRWERQQWHLIELDLAADRDGWTSLRPFTRHELRTGIQSFALGETAVAETLSPLIYAAPRFEDQAFLATQLLDEMRHALLFDRYLAAVEESPSPAWSAVSDSLAALLDRALRETTARVNEAPSDRDTWYRSLVIYHLLVEGVLAVSAMRSIIEGVRRLPNLAILAAAVANVARDESRHISFGVRALHTGVAEGHGAAIVDALCEFTPVAVRALINPQRRHPRLVPGEIQRTIGLDLVRGWCRAEEALVGRTERIADDAQASEAVRRTWASAREAALDEYLELHGHPHPVRRGDVNGR
jgi:ribonucleoside-diphosphate reductase beta chain